MPCPDNTATNPDANILRLEREYDAARAACMPNHPDIDARIATRYAIAEAIEHEPARTVAGHAVKLKVWSDMLFVAFGADSPVPLSDMARSIAAIREAVAAA